MQVPNSEIVFIDTQALIRFYQGSGSDPKFAHSFRSLFVLPEFHTMTTEIVIAEFYRQRAKTFDATMKAFKEAKLEVPSFMSEYPEYKESISILSKLAALRAELMRKAREDFENHNIGADQLVALLFANVRRVTREDHANALIRQDLTLPPRKAQGNSISDGANWEAILSYARLGSASGLIIVSGDGDFASLGNKRTPHEILVNDWYRVAGNRNVKLFDSIENFLREKFPEVHKGANPGDVYWLNRAYQTFRENKGIDVEPLFSEVSGIHSSMIGYHIEFLEAIPPEEVGRHERAFFLARSAQLVPSRLKDRLAIQVDRWDRYSSTRESS